MQNSNSTPQQPITSKDEGATAAEKPRWVPSDVDYKEVAVATGTGHEDAVTVANAGPRGRGSSGNKRTTTGTSNDAATVGGDGTTWAWYR